MDKNYLKFNEVFKNSKFVIITFFLGLIFNIASVVLAYFCLLSLYTELGGGNIFAGFFLASGVGAIICYIILMKANQRKTVMFYFWLAFLLAVVGIGFALNYIVGLLAIALAAIIQFMTVFVFKNMTKVTAKREEENYYQTILLDKENYDIIKIHNLFNAMQTQRTALISQRYKTIKSLYLKIILFVFIAGLAMAGYLMLTGYLFNGFTFGMSMLMLGLVLFGGFFIGYSPFIKTKEEALVKLKNRALEVGHE